MLLEETHAPLQSTMTRYPLAAVAIAITALGLCYGGVIASLMDVWSTNFLYSYGFAVPVIAAYIAWTRAHESRTLNATPDYTFGVPVTLAGMAMLVTGRLGAIIVLEQASLVVTLAGLVLLLFGREVFKSQRFSIAYLLLMVPMWSYAIGQLQDPSRILSTKIAVSLLHAVGVPAFRQATTIVVPGHTFAVLQECSGVNQLIALTAMVLPVAYLWLDTYARRVALFVVAIVVGYLSNGVRIALVGWLAVKGLGDGDLNGPTHLLQGLAVSGLGYLVIGGCFSLLSKSKGRAPQPQGRAATAVPSAGSSPPRRRVWLDAALVCVMLGVGVSRLSATEVDVRLSDDLRSLPSRIGEWSMDSGQEAAAVRLPRLDDDLVGAYPSPTGERRFTAVDDELVRAYRSSSGARVQLYVGHYRRQQQGEELAGDAGHALQAAASGITLKTVSTVSEALALSEVVQERAGTRRGVLFWYDINGRIVRDIYHAKGYTMWDALTRRRTNGAVVMIAWDGPAGVQSEAAREQAIRFAQALMPVLRRHLPS